MVFFYYNPTTSEQVFTNAHPFCSGFSCQIWERRLTIYNWYLMSPFRIRMAVQLLLQTDDVKYSSY